MQPPQGLVEKVKGLGKLKRLADSMPKTVSQGACQELVLEPDLDALPIQHCWPGDPAPFITLPAVITKDPRTGVPQRRHVPDAEDRRALDLHALADPQGRQRRLARTREGSIPVAVALGLDPITAYSASAPLPKHIDEFMLAGFLRGERGRDRQVQDRRPRGAGQRGDRPRGDDRGRRPGDGGAVRRPHRLLLAAGAVPGLPPHVR